MRKGISYLLVLFIISTILFLIVTNIFPETDTPTVAYLLSIIVSHLILGKNEWIIDPIIREVKRVLRQ